MASSLVLVIKSSKAKPSELVGSSTAPHESVNRLIDYLSACTGGAADASIDAYSSTSAPVAASGTVTCASVAADDTVTIGSTTLTAKASPSGENQFSQAGTDTQDAASLVAKINAHSVLSKVVSAANVAGVVTVTMLQKGYVGNVVPLTSSSGTTLAVSGSGFLTGGTGGVDSAARTYRLGL